MPLRPSISFGLVLLPLLLLCSWLGLWQLQRMHEKQDLIDRFGQSAEMELPQAIANSSLFAHVRVSGQYDQSWHLLLDNKVLGGHVGVQALSLFHPDNGLPILVNRGWLPLPADRSSLPEIPTPSGQLNISGILNKPVSSGVRLGEPDHLEALTGPRLITYLDMNDLVTVLDGGLSPWLIQLDANDNTGFAGRDWNPVVMSSTQHGAYALQWFGLALAAAVIWFRLAWQWHHQPDAESDTALGSGNQNPS